MTGGMSAVLILGRPMGGSPCGTAPTTATFRSPNPSAEDSRMPKMSTTRPHGIFGTNLAPRNRIASEQTPITAVSGLTCPLAIAWMIDQARWNTSPDSGLSPSSPGTSPSTIKMTRPNTKPVTMGRLMNSAAQPSLARPPMTSPTPAPIASAGGQGDRPTGSPLAMSATSEPDSTDTVETGPTIRLGDDPSKA